MRPLEKDNMISVRSLSRRAALAALGVCALAGLSGCAPTNAPSVQAAGQPSSGLRISNIEVNTAPLLAQSGNPTAQWAQQALPGALAQAFAGSMAPGDPGGATLSVRIDSIYLGGGGPADPDRMRGVATLSGRAPPQTRLRATSTYIASPVDQALVEQSMQNRVQALSRGFRLLAEEEVGPLDEGRENVIAGVSIDGCERSAQQKRAA